MVIYKQKRSNVTKTDETFTALENYDGKLVFKDIVDATDDFSDKFCIGIDG